MTGLSVSLSLKLTDSILISLAISKIPLCLFQKSTGSMEPVEPVLTTALVMLAQNIPVSFHTEANGCIFFTTGVCTFLNQ